MESAGKNDALRYRTAFQVRFNDVDCRHRVSVGAFFGFLQEAAIRQADENGFGAADLVPRGMTWVMNRMHLRIARYADWKEEVIVETWPSTASGLYATREFCVSDAGGETIALGTSRWVLVDIAARRAMRIPQDISDRFRLDASRSIEDSFPRIRFAGEGIDGHTFHVRRSDLDANNHANSGRYFDWMLESVPHDLLDDWEPESVEIVYKQEALLGNTIHAQYAEVESTAHFRTVMHAIRNASTCAECATGRSIWRRARVS